MTVEIFEASAPRFEHWNELVNEIRAVTEELVRRKTAEIVRTLELPSEFVRPVQRDIALFAMEIEYSNFTGEEFFSALASVYRAGRLPCGWEGEMPPEGRSIIF
jgi:hypothetical protein